MKYIILLSLFILLAFSLPASYKERVKQLNYTIYDQQEQLYRKRLEVRKLWIEKNVAWTELARRSR